MSWNFRKSKSFGPLRFTLTQNGISTSAGAGPLRVSRGADGKYRRTTRIPGTGLYNTEVIGGQQKPEKPPGKPILKSNKQIAVFVTGLFILIWLFSIFGSATAKADDVTCTSDYYSNALWTTCSDGSSSVCLDGGSCSYTSAADRAAGRESRRGFYEDLLRRAGFCNVVRCVN